MSIWRWLCPIDHVCRRFFFAQRFISSSRRFFCKLLRIFYFFLCSMSFLLRDFLSSFSFVSFHNVLPYFFCSFFRNLMRFFFFDRWLLSIFSDFPSFFPRRKSLRLFFPFIFNRFSSPSTLLYLHHIFFVHFFLFIYDYFLDCCRHSVFSVPFGPIFMKWNIFLWNLAVFVSKLDFFVALDGLKTDLHKYFLHGSCTHLM